MKTPVAALFAALLLATSPARAVDLQEIERKLAGAGAEGEVHGSSPSQGLYVFTYRNPSDFFDFIEMSLIPGNPEAQRRLSALNRHDRIRIQGAFMRNPSPQKHIRVSAVELVKKFEPPYEVPAYEYEANLPDELLNRDKAAFLVHAVHADGHILVVEYRDSVLPIHVKNAELGKGLFRGDRVELSFRVQRNPGQPVHLRLNETAENPVKMLDSIQARHGKRVAIEGALVLFPKSPAILFNVFAVLEELPDGLKRQYTLVNFEDPALFAKIRARLQEEWDRHPGQYVNGRNKLVSTAIRVKASGALNAVDPNQANPQILLDSMEALEIR